MKNEVLVGLFIRKGIPSESLTFLRRQLSESKRNFQIPKNQAELVVKYFLEAYANKLPLANLLDKHAITLQLLTDVEDCLQS